MRELLRWRRRFGGKSGGSEPLSRGFLARLWTEKENKKKTGALSVMLGRRKNPKTVQVDAVTDGETFGRWNSLVSSVRNSFTSGSTPETRAARGVFQRTDSPEVFSDVHFLL